MTRLLRRLSPALACAALVALPAQSEAGVPGRDSEPVVVEGATAPALLGVLPSKVVAFRWDDGWQQIPVQVDERKRVDYAAVRGGHQTGGRPFSHLAYADASTPAGPDPDPLLDGDDEIAAMAADAGRAAPPKTRPPENTEFGSRTPLRIVDPAASGPPGYIYLFSGTGLDPAAGRDYVDYDFNLLSGDAINYDFDGVPNGDSTQSGPPGNPENSGVTTGAYSQHFASRWIGDALSVTTGGATGVDILDGDKAQVSYGCGRSELTFSRGGGGFIANIDGPVRAIRSYIGANSGTYTQRDHVFYARAEVTTTYLRVHPGISTITQYLDYSPAANGMTYRNSAFPAGVPIDGVPDPAVQTGTSLGPRLEWEQASGPQGTVTVVNRYATNMPGVGVGSYYEDDLTPVAQQCVGYADTQAWAASGPALRNAGQNTDPTLGAAFTFTGTRRIFFDGPGGDAGLAAAHSARTDAPLQVSVADPDLGLKLKAPGERRVGRRGKAVAKVVNTGEEAITGVKVCARAARKLVRLGGCDRVGELAPGEADRVGVKVALRPDGLDARRVKLRLRARGDGYPVERETVVLKPEG